VIGLDFRPLGAVDFLAHNTDLAVVMHIQSGNLLFDWFGSLGKCFPSLKFFLVDGMGDINPMLQLWKEMDATSLSSHTVNTSGQGSLMTYGFDGTVDERSSMMAGPERGDSILSEPTFRPVLLSARGCGQLFIPMFFSTPDTGSFLLYLDISWTKQKLKDLLCLAIPQQLKVLKLQGLRLTSKEITPLLSKLKVRLFSLDISYNDLTDEVIPVLVAFNCLSNLEQRQNNLPHVNLPPQLAQLQSYFEDAPAYRERSDPTEEQETVQVGAVELREDDVNGVLSHLLDDEQMRLVRGPFWLPPAENLFMQQTGLTHLYLSNNRFTSQALKNLLVSTNRLQLLDFGTAEQYRQVQKSKYPNILAFSQFDTLQLLKPSTSQRLESLRVHHSMATATPTLIPLGDFYLSELRAVYLSEFEYDDKGVLFGDPSRCLPGINNRIRSLTLTHVPRKSFGLVIDRLKSLIDRAGTQELYITNTTPVDPRGARMLPGLRYICLEFAPPENVRKPSATGPSVSGDADADTFMAESMKDFSFFDETTQSPGCETEKGFSFFDERLSEGTPWVQSNETTKSVGKRQSKETSKLLDVKEELLKFYGRTKGAFASEAEGSGASNEPRGAPPAYSNWAGLLEFVDGPASELKWN
jgi:hypothetical protein